MKLDKIMVIDDFEGDQFLAKITIEEFDPNIEVIFASDGKEALEILEQADQQPDLIFLDINMPVMNGHEFLEEHCKRGYKNSVIIMLTSSEQEQDKEKSLAYSCVKDYLVKPLNEEHLKALRSMTI